MSPDDRSASPGLGHADFARGLDVLPDLVFFLSRDGRLTYANKPLLDLWGRSLGDVVGKGFADLDYPPHLVALHRAQVDEVVRTSVPIEGGNVYVSPAGVRGYYEYTFSPVLSDDGTVAFIAGISRDVTDKHDALEAQRRTQQQLDFALEVAEFGRWDLDTASGHASRSLRHDQIFGYADLLPDWTYEKFLSHVLDADRDRVDDAFEYALSKGEDWDFECRIRRADGAVRWIWARGRIWQQDAGASQRMLGVVADITERKAVEERLQAWNETLEARVAERGRQVRDLVKTLTQAEQAVRTRLAHALHDDLQQILFGAHLRLANLGALVDKNPTEACKRLSTVETLVERAVALTRQLAQGLAPPVLGSARLTDVLDWLVLQSEELHGQHVTLDANEAIRVEDDGLRVLIYQVVRELLFNVAKHGGTDEVHVSVRASGDRLHLTVSDRGHGFDPDTVMANREGFGLASMQERIRLIGGELDIDAAVGEGSTITLHLPIRLT